MAAKYMLQQLVGGSGVVVGSVDCKRGTRTVVGRGDRQLYH